MYLINKGITIIVAIILAIAIFTHGEIGQERYGVISRERKNIRDRIIFILLIIFFINLKIWSSLFLKHN